MESVYDRALIEVGSSNTFQKQFDIIYNGLLVGTWAMSYMNIILALVVTPHHCKVPINPSNITEYDWKMKYIPRVADLNGNIKLSECLKFVNNNNNDTTGCYEYDYDKTWYETTVSSENNWVCDKELYVANIYAYSRIGEVVGSILFGYLGDVYGRRPTYIAALTLLVSGRLLSLIGSHSYILFTIGCIIACLPSWTVVQSVTLISFEMSSSERRTITATMRSASFSCGVSIMALIFWWMREWKLVFIINIVLLLPYLIFSWKMIESPRWFWLEGKADACINLLKKIATLNNSSLQMDTEKELLEVQPLKKPKNYGPLALFSGWRLTFHTILQLLLWVCVTLNYTLLMMKSGEKTDGNPFLEFALQAAAEIPGYFIAAWLVDHVGRRYSGILSYSVTALIWMLMTFRDEGNFAWINIWWVSTITAIMARLSVTISYYTINLLNMELYPTCLRQSGMSLGNVFSSGASAIAPYLLYVGRTTDYQHYPSLIMTSVSILGIILSYLLPETKNTRVPETLEDACNFGGQKYNYVQNK